MSGSRERFRAAYNVAHLGRKICQASGSVPILGVVTERLTQKEMSAERPRIKDNPTWTGTPCVVWAPMSFWGSLEQFFLVV
jgi:hypothetical protein